MVRLMNTQEEEYVTLFCEGDGHIRVNNGGYSKVTFDNKERDVVEYVASLIGRRTPRQDKRGYWHLEFNGSCCIPLLEIFSRHVVGKQFLTRLNIVLEFLGMPLAERHPITSEGFVAFWDAEGSSDSQPTLFVSQKDREVLDIICGVFGGGVSRAKAPNGEWKHQWHLSGNKARELYEVILERSHNSLRVERLRENFEGFAYFEHKEKMKAYNKVNNKRLWEERKAIREWMRTHSEEVARLQKSA